MTETLVDIPEWLEMDFSSPIDLRFEFESTTTYEQQNVQFTCPSSAGCTLQYTQSDVDSNSQKLRITGNLYIDELRINVQKTFKATERLGFYPYQKKTFTKREWNETEWTGNNEKPTWDEILSATVEINLKDISQVVNFSQRFLDKDEEDQIGQPKPPKEVRRDIADGATILHDGNEIHVHGGLDRMSGLLQMVVSSNEAGQPIPYIRMRDNRSNPVSIYTQKEIRSLLGALSKRKNIVESAHNQVMQQYQSYVDVRDDPSKSTFDRKTAADDGYNFLLNYKGNLDFFMGLYDPEALPVDLDELKEVYQERLEAHALGRSKYFKGVVTQQGVDLDPSCEDEATALAAVARAEREASIKVNSSDTQADIQAAYDAGVTAINAVLPTRTPEFLLNGTPLGAAPANQQLSVTTFTVWADHPVGLNLTQRVGLSFTLLKDGKKLRDRTGIDINRSTNVRDETRRGITVTFDPAVLAGQTIDMEFQARSICGPSDMNVRVIVPSS